jgi:TonB family protein
MTPRIAIAAVLFVWTSVTAVIAQPLGPVAAEEAARRKAIGTPARVLTNDDLKAAPSPFPDARPASPGDVPSDDPGGEARMPWRPAVFGSGQLPQVAPMAVGGGEVVMELSVTADGRVAAVTVLRATPPFADAMTAAVRRWTFTPAEDVARPAPGTAPDPRTRKPMASKVLVIGLFRPPALFGGTLGQPPADVGKPSEGAPALTSPLTLPLYPPTAMFDGVTLTQISLSATGSVDGVRLLRSSPAFDEPTLAALKSLSFRPPRVHGQPAAANVYVVAAFRQPVTP